MRLHKGLARGAQLFPPSTYIRGEALGKDTSFYPVDHQEHGEHVHGRSYPNFEKVEEMFRLALGGFEKLPGKDSRNTKHCAENLAQLLGVDLQDKEKTQELAQRYPTFWTMKRGNTNGSLKSSNEDPDELVELIKELLSTEE